jgi:hypothetical protein
VLESSEVGRQRVAIASQTHAPIAPHGGLAGSGGSGGSLRIRIGSGLIGQPAAEKVHYYRHRLLLRAAGERPGDSNATEDQEITPVQRFTSSARADVDETTLVASSLLATAFKLARYQVSCLQSANDRFCDLASQA